MSLSVLHYSGLSLISLLDSLSGSYSTVNRSSFPETETVCQSSCLLFQHQHLDKEATPLMAWLTMMGYTLVAVEVWPVLGAWGPERCLVLPGVSIRRCEGTLPQLG